LFALKLFQKHLLNLHVNSVHKSGHSRFCSSTITAKTTTTTTNEKKKEKKKEVRLPRKKYDRFPSFSFIWGNTASQPVSGRLKLFLPKQKQGQINSTDCVIFALSNKSKIFFYSFVPRVECVWYMLCRYYHVLVLCECHHGSVRVGISGALWALSE